MSNTDSSQFHFSSYPQFLLDHKWSSDHMIIILYLTIVALSIVVYKLGFARKLPPLKSLIIYVLLLFGCIIMTILALQLPIVGALTIAAVVLIIYKLRLYQSKRRDDQLKM
ncbi:YlaH-like family protein [Pullulanibacillus sp. KACC 23026]|uniref:YlaH-like family protein n=1 Tax=Pullulanibacillus sp. KACC 23026 TaxID=3028315 RepID=UPI0023AEAE73|nr:YlaH-like family protein [Pullulanibacillus sp. KACC 23026]WEG11713.1 YlaH-like family protein [Pullulanibacillus sp. KACC 23026]